jgi:hypothetical protein
MPRPNRWRRTAPLDHRARVIIGTAWASALLVGTGWALVATAPILILGIAAATKGPRWRIVLPPAAALALSQAVAIALWATRETPPPSLTKDLDPVHAGITVALGAIAALTAHYAVRRDRNRPGPRATA